MLFTTDKQTLEDLNILGRQGSGAVYSLFNRTATVNGAAMLEEMFRYPLSNAVSINQRAQIIAHLASTGANFPFDTSLFDIAEQYLANTDERTRLTGEKYSLEKKLRSLVAGDAVYKTVFTGVTALAGIVQQLNNVLSINNRAADNPYDKDKETVEVKHSLLAAPFSELLRESLSSKLPHEKIVQYDSLFRFQYRDAVRKILAYIYRLDVYTSVAKVAVERGFILPVALTNEDAGVLIGGFYHPNVKNAVPNTLQINGDGNVVFLTGANMAGKSTFMKSLGITMYLAHMGFPVAASKMEFAVLEGIYTTINLPDNLGIGASHFYAEVLRIKKIAKELSTGKKMFVIFDELFRGTNVKDAYEATIAVTAAFAKKRLSYFIISTHIIEAGDVLKDRSSNIRFKFLPTIMEGNTPRYTYKLQTGITADRHGMIIINNEGILDILKNGLNNTRQS